VFLNWLLVTLPKHFLAMLVIWSQ